MAPQCSLKSLALVFALISILFLGQTEAQSGFWCRFCPLPQPPQCPPPPQCPTPPPETPPVSPPPENPPVSPPPENSPPKSPPPETPPPDTVVVLDPPPESPPQETPPPETPPTESPPPDIPPPDTPPPETPPSESPPPEVPPPPPSNSQPSPPPPQPQSPPTPPPNFRPPPPPRRTCPRNPGLIRQCSNILRNSGNTINLGSAQPCCNLIRDLSDVDAANCLCDLLRAQGSTSSTNITILCRTCGRGLPRGFTCP